MSGQPHSQLDECEHRNGFQQIEDQQREKTCASGEGASAKTPPCLHFLNVKVIALTVNVFFKKLVKKKTCPAHI